MQTDDAKNESPNTRYIKLTAIILGQRCAEVFDRTFFIVIDVPYAPAPNTQRPIRKTEPLATMQTKPLVRFGSPLMPVEGAYGFGGVVCNSAKTVHSFFIGQLVTIPAKDFDSRNLRLHPRLVKLIELESRYLKLFAIE